ncbi:beta-galactosidase [Desertivirga arenae]|uniref:beta-galactosidase n=1 Tax=Desertivirga arenae TaxID=2810309 RepID=UPI001F622C0A|nr:beta-galactosidase [Pedobacter sp. SYSU D00823]
MLNLKLAPIRLGLCFLLIVIFSSFKGDKARQTFEIGKEHFLLNGKPFQIRCGELHFARVPKPYWRHRLKMMRSLGMNTVCAYLFWNFHERSPGTFKWNEEADIAAFCKMAQEEGLWVILRPGPYTCAEWEMGGLPWWLLKYDDIALRSKDLRYIAACQNYLKQVGKVLAPLQITQGGPILMVQVENEYGFYADDADYMGIMRKAISDAGFNVPLFACNPPYHLKKGFRKDLFQVVNFGTNPQEAFKSLREVQSEGPLMCGEFYSGWFDTWGTPHNYGKIDQYLKDMEYMLKNGNSFSIYMAHGGSSFGFWAGADRPFKPDVSSYDYGAPVSEAGLPTEKFFKTRALISRYLMPGEPALPPPPSTDPAITFKSVSLTNFAPLFENLPAPTTTTSPKTMEYYDQAQGSILYRTTLPSGPACTLKIGAVHDFAWIYINGENLGVMDRRKRNFQLTIPARAKETRVDILVHAMGRINFGPEVHDRKGLVSPIQFVDSQQKVLMVGDWNVYNLSYSEEMLKGLKYGKKIDQGVTPGIWKGEFSLSKTGDTYLDLSKWGKGVVWVNGHCLGRFWNIGPTQTMYLPGPWLKKGVNEVRILDLLGPEVAELRGLEQPILNDLHPEKDFTRSKRPEVVFNQENILPIYQGKFPDSDKMQSISFPQSGKGRYFCFAALSSFSNDVATIAELDLLDATGKPISHQNWTIGYVSSEELIKENGGAENAIDGQTFNFWSSEWSYKKALYPHYLVIDLGREEVVTGLKYIPKAGSSSAGRVKEYKIFLGNEIVRKKN